MELNSLFNRDRKDAVRKAVDCDTPLPGHKSLKPIVEPPHQDGPAVSDLDYLNTMREIVLRGGLIPRPSNKFRVNHNLYEAIRTGDLNLAKAAIWHGADIHSEAGYVPPTTMTQTFISEPMTPLQYAIKINQHEMAELLRQNGAKA